MEVKSGPVEYFTTSLFGLRTRWKSRYLVLYKDSTLTWYNNHTRSKNIGTVIIEPVCDYIAYGDFTLSVSDRPAQPKGATYMELLSVTKGMDWNAPREWFLFNSMEELSDWIGAIMSTLSHIPSHIMAIKSPHGPPQAAPANYGQPAGFGQDTNAGTGMIVGAAALGMGANMMGMPFVNPGMSDFGGTMGGMDLF